MTIQERVEVAREVESEEDAQYETNEVDGQLYEEFTVHNVVAVKTRKMFRGFNPTIESFEPTIETQTPGVAPNAVTADVADELWFEESIDVEDHDIEVVDLDDDEIKRI